MENNLYYTPTIEEFHVGFECELIDNDKTFKWFPIECTQETLYDVQSNHYNARVKYLDQSDIERLGWEYTSKSIDNWYELKGNFQIPYTCFKIVLSHGIFDKRIRIFADDQGSEDILFRGTIKNKSELIKLM